MKEDSIIAKKTFVFALKIIELYIALKAQNEYILSKQIVRAGTSVGANVNEAGAAASKKDFIAKMQIASKEARETLFFLKLLNESNLVKYNFEPYLTECQSIVNILTKIIKTSQENLNNGSKSEGS